jgi:peptidoglycan/LPS O-acetylase OafA/YrhL
VAREGLFNRILEMRALRYLGKISYGLYVYHVAIIWFVARIRDFLPISGEPMAKFLTALISLPLSILVASLSYFLLEKPILNLKERYFSLRQSKVKEGTIPVEKALPG